MKRFILCVALLLISVAGFAAQQYSATGMVLKVDRPHKTFLVSCQSIPGFMAAMTMPFDVRDKKELEGLAPGMTVDFTLIVDQTSSYAQRIHIRSYESVEQDPLTARRLKLLNHLGSPEASSSKLVAIGRPVPDFALTDQRHQRVALSEFAGKVVALNFIYTSCALPNFCYRISNNFGVLQRRFKEQLGRDLILLTVTFDPQRDQPDVLAHYASNWKADPATWHFLTGSVPEVQRVTDMFGMDFFPDEGLMNHSLHTAVIDRDGKLVANIEGNQFTADQLGDLVQTTLRQHHAPVRLAHNAGSKSPSADR
jgi:protein SCO1/2